ncbi:hypothetical protein HAX54_023390 [Datura stramonium]|uniref:Uncharacterized protein n=1 Tax=Datura stramonium TaxID=4076 RepID=A0ABS8UXN9_DATST|nr:hypothetical protein [Datura stramonium]
MSLLRLNVGVSGPSKDFINKVGEGLNAHRGRFDEDLDEDDVEPLWSMMKLKEDENIDLSSDEDGYGVMFMKGSVPRSGFKDTNEPRKYSEVATSSEPFYDSLGKVF